MNDNYFPLENMQRSVDILKASSDIHLPTLEYGQYHLILTPADRWPDGSAAYWHKEKGRARVDLSTQPNCTPLSNDEPGVIPLTRCDLLDARPQMLQLRAADPDEDEHHHACSQRCVCAPTRDPAQVGICQRRGQGANPALSDDGLPVQGLIFRRLRL
ncbi:hypothetical protein [Bradyrhizobium sp. STM 3566]|uniref:hypothetical protein n=1 Tax=Bradyrhizobium sp. STM 3566 TaxID=578928 RepID=UPI00388EEA9A